MEWRPIDSAPKDGTRILVLSRLADDRTWVYGIAEWRDDFGRHVEPGSLTVGWTHWMPLPPPPGEAPAADLPVRNERPPREDVADFIDEVRDEMKDTDREFGEREKAIRERMRRGARLTDHRFRP